MNAMDASPVTHGELREALTQAEQRLNDRIDQTEQRLDHKVNRALELWGGALIRRIERGEQRLAAIEGRLTTDLPLLFLAMEQQMSAELARHARSFAELHQSQLAAIDEKYTELPPRVRRLEAAVFTRDKR